MGTPYDVVLSDDTDDDGAVYYSDQIITLREGIPDAYARRVLLHEIIHIILFNASVEDHDEHLIDIMANGIDEVLLHNEELRDLYDE